MDYEQFEAKLANYFNADIIRAASIKPFHYIWIIKEWGVFPDFVSSDNDAYKELMEGSSAYKEAMSQYNKSFKLAKEKSFFVIEELLTVIGRNELRNHRNKGFELSENLYRALGGYNLRLRYTVDGKVENNFGAAEIWDKVVTKKIMMNLIEVLNAFNVIDYSSLRSKIKKNLEY